MDLTNFDWQNQVLFTDNNIDQSLYNWQLPLNTFYTDINTYFMLACNRFKWESEKIKPFNRFGKLLEFYLNTRGQAFITKDTLSVYQGCTNGDFDEFGIPKTFTLYGYNGNKNNGKVYNYDDVIWIKNNMLKIPTIYWILKYCKRINIVEKTMDLNMQAQKTPYIAEANPLIAESIKLMFEDIDSLKKLIITDDEKSIIDNIKIIKLEAPYLIDKLQDQKYNEENQLLQILGIDTINEKNAHMLYAEVENSNEITDSYSDIFISERKIGFEQLKEVDNTVKLSMIQHDTSYDEMNGGENIVDNYIKEIN